MMKTIGITLLLLLFCGCTSFNLDHNALLDLYFTQGKEPGQYIVCFGNGFSGGPIVDYKLKVDAQGKQPVYKLYIYSDLFRTKPRAPISVDKDHFHLQIGLTMPDFRVGTDTLLIVDQSGEFPIEYRKK